MSEPSVFAEIFKDLQRLAPGSEASSLRALEIVRRELEPTRLLDAGCGTGASTLVLLRNTTAAVTAVDVDSGSLEVLLRRAAEARVDDRLRTAAASIDRLDFAPGSFDVIWSEGAIYTIGFDRGLLAWHPFLKPGGFVICSELTWLTDSPSARARAFWAEGYPAMRDLQANIGAAEALGYGCAESFVLPSSDWVEEYYGPLRLRVDSLRSRYRDDASASGVLDGIEAEIALYEACGDEYGYVFYVLQRP